MSFRKPGVSPHLLALRKGYCSAAHFNATAKMPRYSLAGGAHPIFESLIKDSALPFPQEVRDTSSRAKIVGDMAQPPIPIKFKASEAIVALKALEGTVASALVKERFNEEVDATVDVIGAIPALFISFMTTIDGFNQLDSESYKYLQNTDVNDVYRNVYRLMATNIYRTKDDRYFHLHGSLDATPTLAFLGLPGFRNDLKDATECRKIIEAQTRSLNAAELESKVRESKQAGSTCFEAKEFLQTPHGQVLSKRPLIEFEQLESSSPPVKLSPGGPNILSGVKILDLTRVIAGPVITRTLAEYGADVIRVSSSTLGDTPFYSVCFSLGKRTLDLNLKTESDRATFESLLDDADVIVDGFRPGALAKLGYGKEKLVKRFANRGRGFVYTSENCFGWDGPWRERSGWQQIADSVTGLSWEHGKSWGKNEPIEPPFALTDYGTAALGCIATLNGLYRRQKYGGSYWTATSLVQFNMWMMSLGTYEDKVWAKMVEDHKAEFLERKVGHSSPAMQVFSASLGSVQRNHPELWDEKYIHNEFSESFGGKVRTHKPVVLIPHKSGWLNTTRKNGADAPEWLSAGAS